jgi:hypothetical protein
MVDCCYGFPANIINDFQYLKDSAPKMKQFLGVATATK